MTQKVGTTPAVVENERTIVDGVLSKITKFQESGELKLPKDYSAENALKSAYLMIGELKSSTGVPILQIVTHASVANTLLNMVVQGLSPMKNQCYFIPYGDQLQLSRSYLGSIAVAKRVGLDKIQANVIYNDDEFSYKIDNETGLSSVIEHNQKFDNIDISKIRGAYAITIMSDGTRNLTLMTMAQIQKSWMQGATKGKSPAHNNFTDEMCKKTVYNRACKIIINSSTDVMLNTDSETDVKKTEVTTVNVQPNSKELDVEDAKEIKPETVEKTVKEPVAKADEKNKVPEKQF